MQDATCRYCGGTALEPGFLGGQQAGSFIRWFAGPLQRGPMGGARRLGRRWQAIEGLSCRDCGRIELFAGSSG